jgi:tripartite-type tricarboxylate transporter receptor subunit TctC
MRIRHVIWVGALALAASAGAVSAAEDNFYEGKSVRFILSAGEGGGYATYARSLIHHLGKHLPGDPTFVLQSMPGGGGLRATNYLFTQAAKDGSTLGMIHATVILAPIYGTKSAQFDSREFNWLGAMSTAVAVCVAWHESPIKTWNDMLTKEFIVGSSGAGSQMETMPLMINRLFGTKMKVISGYKDGTSVFLAMQRGEVHGRCGGIITALRATRPDWLTENKIVVPVAVATQRHPDYPDSPSIMEFVKDEHTRKVLELVFAPQEFDRPVLAPPGVPAERVALLRKAFGATLKDPAFLAEAKKLRIDIDLVSGERLQQIIQNAYDMPSEVVTAAKAAMGNQGHKKGGE